MHRDIGYLPEQPYFYDYLTAAEVLDYFARFHDLTAADRNERVARMLKKVGLETAGKIQLRKYSKGMLQRVGLAQAILHDPQVVILDEPMSGLDPIGRREVRDIILELKRDGKTVMFSTHILSDAEMLCDRVGVIVGGKLRGVGAPGEMVGMKAQGMEILFELPGGVSNAAGDCRESDEDGRSIPLAGYRRRIVRGAGTASRGGSEDSFRGASEGVSGRVFHAPGRSGSRASGGGRGEREMRRAGVVALNTFREAVRDRVLYNLVFFALLMMAAAIFVGQISIGIEEEVIKSLGLSAISVIGLLIAVFIGVGLVYKEMDKRTLYALLAKPVRRWEFLLGKFGGLVLTLAVNTLAMTAGLFAALLYVKHHLERTDGVLLIAVYFILLKLMLVVALALLFSCFSTPLLAILYTSAFYVAGLFVVDMRTFHFAGETPAMVAFYERTFLPASEF